MIVSCSSLTPFAWNAKSQYQTDASSGLMLLGNRYYDCTTGRFISQDPAQDESNWYSYCGNDPLVAVDPSGLVQHQNGSALYDGSGFLGFESLGEYFGDVGDFAKGEASALNPVAAIQGTVDTLSYLNQSHWSLGAFKAVGAGFLDGLNPLNKTGDMHAAGQATMSLTLALSPMIKKIPNPTSIALEGPWRLGRGGVMALKVIHAGEQVLRVEAHKLRAHRGIPPALHGRTLPHWHPRGPGGIGRHHPWER